MADTTPPIAPAVQRERERFENSKRVEDLRRRERERDGYKMEARAIKRTR
jgi:hypothetical protein